MGQLKALTMVKEHGIKGFEGHQREMVRFVQATTCILETDFQG
jgi:hypothetical protein